jgi:hypothetical protein
MSSFSRSSSSEGNASYRNPKTVMQIQKTHSFLWLLSGKMECQSIPKAFIITRSTKILDRLAGIYGAWLGQAFLGQFLRDLMGITQISHKNIT